MQLRAVSSWACDRWGKKACESKRWCPYGNLTRIVPASKCIESLQVLGSFRRNWGLVTRVTSSQPVVITQPIVMAHTVDRGHARCPCDGQNQTPRHEH